MASGYWSETNKPIRPGFYNRFKAAAASRIESGKSGIVAMPVKSNWGPVKQIVHITSEKDLITNFGSDSNFTAYKLGKLALLGQPKELLLYRVVDGTEKVATATLKDTTSTTAIDVLKINTKYPTTREFNVTVRNNIIDPLKKDIILFEGSTQLYVFSGVTDNIAEIVDVINKNEENLWIVASKVAEGNGKLANISNKALTSGNNGTTSVTNEKYIEAMAAFESVKFNGFCLDGVTDSALQTSVKSWIDRNRKNGKKIRAYLGGPLEETVVEANTKAKSFNHEGVNYVGIVGGIYNGIKYTPAETACYIAALGEGIDLKESLCNMVTIFSDVTKNLTDEEIQSTLKAGTIIIRYDNGSVSIEDDVNTLKSYGTDQNETLGYLRAIRFIDTVDEDTSLTGNNQYVGKIPNGKNGQVALISALKQYFETLEAGGYIEDFTVEIDEELQVNAKNDEFFWRWDAKYINVMKRIFGTGYIR